LQQREANARLNGNQADLKGVLSAEAQFLQNAQKDLRLTPKQKLALTQQLGSVKSEIDSIDQGIAQNMKDKAAALAEASAQLSPGLLDSEFKARLSGSRKALIDVLKGEAASFKAKLAGGLPDAQKQEVQQNLLGVVSELDSLNQAIIADAKAKRDAIKQAAAAFKTQASDIKNAVLAAFDFKTTKIDNARALADAKQALTLARRIGGTEGIKHALRDFQDAQLAIRRQTLESRNFSVTGGPAGPVNALHVGNVTIQINSNQDPSQIAKQVIAVLNRTRKHGVNQFSGTAPDHNTMT
jgi:hypothetical protein